VLPTIESIAGKLATTHTHPREMERAARVLAALTRTLRELDSQLRQHVADEAARREESVNIETMRRNLLLKLEAIVGAEDDAEGSDL
jgi:hypothetical protein